MQAVVAVAQAQTHKAVEAAQIACTKALSTAAKQKDTAAAQVAEERLATAVIEAEIKVCEHMHEGPHWRVASACADVNSQQSCLISSWLVGDMTDRSQRILHSVHNRKVWHCCPRQLKTNNA